VTRVVTIWPFTFEAEGATHYDAILRLVDECVPRDILETDEGREELVLRTADALASRFSTGTGRVTIPPPTDPSPT